MNNYNLTLLHKSLDAAAMRQEAINSNIANVNTDNYKVNQVVFESLLEGATSGLGLEKTNAKHFGVGNLSDVEPVLEKRMNTTIKENGNNVDVDIEMVNLSQNALYYQALTAQLNGQYSRLNTVING